METTTASSSEASISTGSVNVQGQPQKQRKFAKKVKHDTQKMLTTDTIPRTMPLDLSKDQLLFQRLAHDMVDRLMESSRIDAKGKSLDLVERLSTPPSTTTTSTTTSSTTEINIVFEETVAFETTGPLRETSDTSQLIRRSEQSMVEHLNTQATRKIKYLIPFYHINLFTTHHAASSHIIRKEPNIYTLDDFAAIAALESLFERFGRVSHMGILDKSYTFFINKARDGALYFKVKNNIAVVGGDPLCERKIFPQFLDEFADFRKRHQLGIAFLGASEDFVQYAKEQNWATMQFGTERVLNPLTNPILLEKGGKTGKRMTNQNKQLLDPKKGGLSVEVYSPSVAKDPVLQEQLVGVYDAWREHRNQSGVPQAYITVFDPFALPDLMTYIYTKDRSGMPNGFAALRKLGANSGFHIDPCVAAPGAPRGITDLLIFAAMALLNKAGISYLSFGFEPLDELGEITGVPKYLTKITRSVHGQVFGGLKVAGKKDYHAKFRPDETQQSALFLVFPDGVPGIRHMTAMVHIANISVRQLVISKWKKVSVTKFHHQQSVIEDQPASSENQQVGASSSEY